MHHTEEELIVNVDAVSKDKFPVAVGDIIEISVPGEAIYPYVLVDTPPPKPPTSLSPSRLPFFLLLGLGLLEQAMG